MPPQGRENQLAHQFADSAGAEFPTDLRLPDTTIIVSKATTSQKDAYSGFEGTDLAAQLKSRGINRLFIGGLTTDYCVFNTVKDALSHGVKVGLLLEAIRVVNLRPANGQTAIDEMVEGGAASLHLADFDAESSRTFMDQENSRHKTNRTPSF